MGSVCTTNWSYEDKGADDNKATTVPNLYDYVLLLRFPVEQFIQQIFVPVDISFG